MVREPLEESTRAQGARLGHLLRQSRGQRSMVNIAQQAGISVETLRKIENGRIPTPALFTVAAIAEVLGVSLDWLITASQENTALAPGLSSGPAVPSTP